jgi:small ligand-binding sensory domain FIST
MQVHTALSQAPLTENALEDVCREIIARLGGRSVDLAFAFFSPDHSDSADLIVKTIHDRLHPTVLLGCSAESVIGDAQEVEGQPALSLWAGHLPGASLTPFHLEYVEAGDQIKIAGWPDTMPALDPTLSFLVIAEPFTATPAETFLEDLATRYPGASAIGGMASGAQEPGANRLIFNDTVVGGGVIGVAVTGAVCIRTVVSQGCRPIGDRFMITQAEQNIIHELSGKPALDRLREVFALLSPAEQHQAERALHLGIVIDEHKDQFERGDFLIRNLMGIDQKTGSVAMADYARVGQTVQFQLRDGASASEDLRALLTGERTAPSVGDPIGALLFSCNGRGQRFFRTPHHDITTIQKQMGGIPVGGFFAMGEIGPVGGNNFLHGYTASVALFCKNG